MLGRSPWSEAPYANAEIIGTTRGLSLDGFLSKWALMTRLDPIYSAKNPLYIGYTGELSAALRVTRRRALDRKKRHLRNMSFSASPFSELYAPTTNELFVVNTVGTDVLSSKTKRLTHFYRLQKKTLIMREITQDSLEKMLLHKDALAVCDIAGFINDRFGSTHMTLRAKELLVQVASHGESSGYEVHCLVVAAKGDLAPYPKAIEEFAKAYVDAMLPQIRKNTALVSSLVAVALVDAENWISHMEKIFDVMDCNDAFKTILAVYNLRLRIVATQLGNPSWTGDDNDRFQERSDKRHKSGDRYHPYSQQVSTEFTFRVMTTKNDRKGQTSKGRWWNSGTGRDQRNRGSQQSRVPSEGYTHPVCNTCGRRHPGECRRAAGTCFKCGQAGHLQRDCKKNMGASSSGHADKKPDASGRVFALTQDQAANTSVNALPLDMCEFDIILGMDWLAAHRATIDCHSRRVIFGDIHAPEFIYHGSLPGKPMKIISALKARYLTSACCVKDVFPDNFQEYLLFATLSFKTLSLFPGVSRSSKALIRMAPIEFKKNKRINYKNCKSEVLFARDVSPRGSPVLLSRRRMVAEIINELP
ncbi:putative reverse transcriptase domain-containing protein [Tanacetum coccineum]|uniref:Reverse transcriptase domain-containing protein n=1 Tax=Tanacetum coccineum TaxID=301880 RepID=A0ABQ5G5B7_9ASTR